MVYKLPLGSDVDQTITTEAVWSEIWGYIVVPSAELSVLCGRGGRLWCSRAAVEVLKST
jgi:hypothetical protein